MNHKTVELTWDEEVTLGVVMASEGYPASSTKGSCYEMDFEDVDSMIFHMGTKEIDGNLVTDGGRVLIVVSKEKNH